MKTLKIYIPGNISPIQYQFEEGNTKSNCTNIRSYGPHQVEVEFNSGESFKMYNGFPYIIEDSPKNKAKQ